MKTVFVLLVLAITLTYVSAFENFLAHPLYPCIRCLCHARTGCWRRQNCASYSISKEYWLTAGGLTVTGSTAADDWSYNKCLQNENCIVGTIIKYTEYFGHKDCNCDGSYDCKDRLAIHLFGVNCENPQFTSTYASRFNQCSREVGVDDMLSSEGYNGCIAPDLE